MSFINHFLLLLILVDEDSEMTETYFGRCPALVQKAKSTTGVLLLMDHSVLFKILC